MYKLLVPKNKSLIFFQNPQFKLWDVDKVGELLELWGPFENKVYALEWVNLHNAKVSLILPNENTFNDISFLAFKNVETNKIYCFWVDRIEFNSADKKNISLYLTWDIFFDEVFKNSKVMGYLEQSTLPEYTYYYKNDAVVYDKEALSIKEGFTIPKTDITYIGKLSFFYPYGNIYHFIKKATNGEVALPLKTNDNTNFYLENGSTRDLKESNTFYFLPNKTKNYGALIASDNLIKTFNSILPKTALFITTTNSVWDEVRDYIRIKGSSLSESEFYNQYTQSVNFNGYTLEGLNLLKTYFFDDSFYLRNGKNIKVIKHRDNFLKAAFFNNDEIWLFYKNLTAKKIRTDALILSDNHDAVYLDDYTDLAVNLSLNGLSRAVWYTVFGNIRPNIEISNFDYGWIPENALSEIPLFYEEEFKFDLNWKKEYNLKLECSAEHNDIILHSFYGMSKINNFTYFLNKTSFNIFIGETFTLGPSGVLTARLFGDNNIINLDPATSAFYKTDKFLDYLFTNGSAFMTSKNYADLNYSFTEQSNKLSKDMAITSLVKSIFGGLTGIGNGVISSASQGFLTGGPVGAIAGGISGGISSGVGAAFGIAGSALSFQQTELNNKIALSNAQQNIDMINAKQEDLSRQSNAVFSNDRAKNSIQFGYNLDGCKINSVDNGDIVFYKWGYSKAMKETINNHYKMYGWKNNKLIEFNNTIKKSPKFDYVKINNCVVKNTPKIYHDTIINVLNAGVWFCSDLTLEDIYNIDFKENILNETDTDI